MISEHQMQNEINYNTTQLDKRVGREFGFHSRKAHRKMRCAALAKGPQNPYKTSGRREMRALLESLRTFEPFPAHPRGNRETRRKMAKTIVSAARLSSKKRESVPAWDMRLWWHSPHHQMIPRASVRRFEGLLPEDFRD